MNVNVITQIEGVKLHNFMKDHILTHSKKRKASTCIHQNVSDSNFYGFPHTENKYIQKEDLSKRFMTSWKYADIVEELT